MTKKFFIIAGEASGDLHGGNLVKSLLTFEPDINFQGIGGGQMEKSGVEILTRYETVNFMGFIEVLKNIKTILNLITLTKKQILNLNPDAIILIDYPGFNLRIAKWAKRHNYKIYYYISPQIWAWKESRVHLIKQSIQKMFVILPFEKVFYKKFNLDVEYHGHPLANIIYQFKGNVHFRQNNKLDNRAIIALLPGSRRQEISMMLPLYLKAVKKECKFQIVIAGMEQHRALYEKILGKENPNVKIIYQQNYELLHQSYIALVTSGTATLETALFRVPQVVCYKGSVISYWIARLLIKVKYISLVNLILDQKRVEELIQENCTVQKIMNQIEQLKLPTYRHFLKSGYSNLIQILKAGDTSGEIAKIILKDLQN